ncbi:hypothetical protein Tco_1240748, partial [Tanacetum coccineum]
STVFTERIPSLQKQARGDQDLQKVAASHDFTWKDEEMEHI